MTDDSPSYPTVRILNTDTYAEFVVANPDLKDGDYVPIEALEQLADFLESVEGRNHLLREVGEYPEFGRVNYVNRTAEQCAQELRELVEEHR